MDNEQAKFILQAYRPSGQDADDPQFEEALERARRDPELAAWFDAERELDLAIGEKLREAPIPADLKSTILAGNKVVRPQIWWRQPAAMAIAACVAIALTLAALLMPGGEKFDEYHTDMVAFINNLDRLDMTSRDVSVIKAWLGDSGGHPEYQTPAKMDDVRGLGCRVFDWNGSKVTLICMRNNSDGLHDKVHLLVINRDDLSIPAREDRPIYANQGNLVTASWSKGDYSYILAGHGKQTSLQKYF